MKRKFRVRIADTDVSHLVQSFQEQQRMNESSKMEIVLRCETDGLRSVYLAGVITLEIEHDGEFISRFHGFVVKAQTDQTYYRLQCVDRARLFQEGRIGSVPGPGLHPSELIYYLTASIDPDHVLPEHIHYDQQHTLADNKVLFQRRRYVFVAPLPFCHINVNDVNIADARIYKVEGTGGVDDRNILASFPYGWEIPPEWRPEIARIRFYIMAEGFLDAYEKGRARLRQFLDHLSFGANLTTPCYEISGEPRFLEYNRDRLLTGVYETDWAYVRDTLGADRYWLRWYQPHRSGDPFTLVSDDPILATYPLLKPLFECTPESLNNSQRSLLNALHALRQSRQAPDTLDSLVNLFNCMEFLVSGIETPKLLKKNEIKQIIAAAQGAVNTIYADATLEERTKRLERIKSILSEQLNKPPLRTKWNLFCGKHNLHFTEAEQNLLWEALRKPRNDHQHGRVAGASRNDLNQAGSIMEKAIIAALK